jgi:hypothetical protein
MRLRTLFVVCLLAALGAHAAPPSNTDDVLLRQTRELLNAVTDGAANVWDRYLHERATITSEDGSVSTKADLVKGIKPLPAGVSGTLNVVDFKAFVHGKVAVTNYIADEQETYYGHELHCQYRSTDTWLQTNAGWRLIASQTIALRTDPPAIALSDAQADAYVGTYALTPAITYEIRRKDKALEGRRSGREWETLSMEAPDVLFVPGKPRYRKIFQRDGAGRIVAFAERREAWDLVWERLPPKGD